MSSEKITLPEVYKNQPRPKCVDLPVKMDEAKIKTKKAKEYEEFMKWNQAFLSFGSPDQADLCAREFPDYYKK